MAKILVEEKPYKTYTLWNETEESSITVIPERGGIILGWTVNDVEVLYLDRERFQNPALSIRGGIPILFPICGNLPDDRYELEGHPYTLTQHGFARNLPWQVTQEIATEGQTQLSIALNSTPETLKAYPFEFTVTYTYRLQGNRLEIHQAYQNKSTKTMPCSFGFHPYFTVGDKQKLRFEIPAQHWQDKATGTSYPFANQFDFGAEELDMALYPVTGYQATVTDLERSFKLYLDYDRPFSTLVFWTLKDKDFYCLEPWSAPRNALNTGDRLTQIAPGETLETWVKLTVESL